MKSESFVDYRMATSKIGGNGIESIRVDRMNGMERMDRIGTEHDG